MNDNQAIIQAMREQEKAYRPSNYMDQVASTKSFFGLSSSKAIAVDADCRSRMVEWCYQVVDFCKMNRDTVAVAMSHLDRFLSTPEGEQYLTDRKQFQLAAMTCLYTAIKVNEAEAMQPQVISSLSRKAFNAKSVEETERKVLSAIKWRMNPPTPAQFVHTFASFLPEDMDENERNTVVTVANYQTELALQEYEFVSTNASTIAFAAFANALQTMESNEKYDTLEELAKVTNVDVNSTEYITTQGGLWMAIDHSVGDRCKLLLPVSPTVTKIVGASTCGSASPRGVVTSKR